MHDLSGLKSLLGKGLKTGEADLLAYSYDGALERARPDAVVVARDAGEVQATVAWCVENRVPYTARGAGTNLSGGCIPLRGGVILSLVRMDRILAVDTQEGFALVEPGAVNLKLQEALAKVGRFYAPDPASYKVCTLGGNIGENAGGPRCIKYGTTTHHVRRLEAVMPDGSRETFSREDAGPELMSLLVGAEGTLGIVTKAWVDILPVPEMIATILVAFASLEEAMACVGDIVASGIAPRVLEAMDRMTVDSIEAYIPSGYPQAEAVLLIEVEGARPRVDLEIEKVRAACAKRGSTQYRVATETAQREKLWEGRRSAYAALSRLAPNVLVEDGVVPRSKLVQAASRLKEIALKHRVKAGLLFHAGDGNLHPNIIFDERDKEETARVRKAGREILKTCVDLGGSISGEHGIGADKRSAMAWLFTPETLALFGRIKHSFDPHELANPDKLFPLPGEGPGGEVALPPRRAPSDGGLALIQRVKELAAAHEPLAVVGARTRCSAPKDALSLKGLDKVLELERSDLVATVEAGISPVKLQEILEPQGLYSPIPLSRGTLGGMLATKPWVGLRNDILAMRILLADGTVADVGAKVVKSVAGYDVPRLLLGSWGTLAVILEVTLKLYARRPELPRELPDPIHFKGGVWWSKLKDAFDPARRLNAWVENDAR